MAEATGFQREDLGVLWAYQLFPGEPAAELAPNDAQTWLQNPQSEGFLWLHLNLANNAALPWLKAGVDLPDAFDEALTSATRCARSTSCVAWSRPASPSDPASTCSPI